MVRGGRIIVTDEVIACEQRYALQLLLQKERNMNQKG